MRGGSDLLFPHHRDQAATPGPSSGGARPGEAATETQPQGPLAPPGLSRLWAPVGRVPTPLPRPRAPAARASFLRSFAPALCHPAGPTGGPEVAATAPPRPVPALPWHSLFAVVAAATATAAAWESDSPHSRDRPTSPPHSAPAPPLARGRGARPGGRSGRRHPLAPAHGPGTWSPRPAAAVAGQDTRARGRVGAARCGAVGSGNHARPPPCTTTRTTHCRVIRSP